MSTSSHRTPNSGNLPVGPHLPYQTICKYPEEWIDEQFVLLRKQTAIANPRAGRSSCRIPPTDLISRTSQMLAKWLQFQTTRRDTVPPSPTFPARGDNASGHTPNTYTSLDNSMSMSGRLPCLAQHSSCSIDENLLAVAICGMSAGCQMNISGNSGSSRVTHAACRAPLT